MSYSIPYSFIPGTKARAQEVNANFNYVLDSLDSINNDKLNKSLSNLTQEGLNVIKNNVVARNIGEIFYSLFPLEDAGVHLLDGALISGSGSYSEFVDYIADLYDGGDYPDIFETEANWQTSVTTYGVCGKFVYDSVNNTVRLPKITGIVEGTTDLTALGDLVQAGLPNVTGTFYADAYTQTATGAYTVNSTSSGYNGTQGSTIKHQLIGMNASRSSSIYGNSTTVQPQTIKILYYIVIATSTKTDIQVDIDEIATDLNGKAGTDLANVNATGKKFITNQCVPDLPASNPYQYNAQTWNTAFQLPENAYVFYAGTSTTASGTTIRLQYSLDGTTFYDLELPIWSASYLCRMTPLLPKGLYIKGAGGSASQVIGYILAKGGV